VEADKEEFIIGIWLLSIDANRQTAVKIKAGARTLLHPSTFANDCIAAASEVAVTISVLLPACAPQTFAKNLR
jgi:hypothetical protein